MLIVKGNCLLLSHLPTSHTTVRAVPHTAVPILGAIRDTPRLGMDIGLVEEVAVATDILQ